ncbi:Hypothetical_protein [Hexamita inflata]|uniref:Hypothetical_protein n=1 Tax=Hexamita inflata TaxID=28002 RepID=A0AA86RZF0_9EUKA|nr:Hypothetical protein HINF_LOCUS62950 [Hexamita inflata]
MPQITIRLGRPTLSNSNSTVTEMIDFNYVTQLHKQAQKGALTKHEELNTAGTNQRRPSEVFKFKIMWLFMLQLLHHRMYTTSQLSTQNIILYSFPCWLFGLRYRCGEVKQ